MHGQTNIKFTHIKFWVLNEQFKIFLKYTALIKLFLLSFVCSIRICCDTIQAEVVILCLNIVAAAAAAALQ